MLNCSLIVGAYFSEHSLGFDKITNNIICSVFCWFTKAFFALKTPYRYME